MFNDVIENLFKGVGQKIERGGKSYLKLDEKIWSTNDLFVTAEIAIPFRDLSSQVGWNQVAEADLKVLISVRPKTATNSPK